MSRAACPPRPAPAPRAAPHLGLQVPQADDGLLVLARGFVVAAQLEEPVPFSVEDGHGLHLLLVVQAPRLPLVLARGLDLARERGRVSERGPRAPAPRSWGPASSAFSTGTAPRPTSAPQVRSRQPLVNTRLPVFRRLSPYSSGQNETLYCHLLENWHHKIHIYKVYNEHLRGEVLVQCTNRTTVLAGPQRPFC